MQRNMDYLNREEELDLMERLTPRDAVYEISQRLTGRKRE